MTEETAEVIENAVPPEETATPEEAPKEENNIQKRFDKITQQKYEAFAERDQAKKEAEELKRKIEELSKKTTKEPTLEDFDYDEAGYNKALIAQEAERAAQRILAEREQAEKQNKAAQKAQERAKAFAAKQAKFAGEIEDYDETVNRMGPALNVQMAEMIAESDQGPAVAYHLGKNLDKAYEIAQLAIENPLAAQREILKIEAGLAKPKTVSNAPTPVPDDVGGLDVPTLDMDKLPIAEWMKRRNRQVHGS